MLTELDFVGDFVGDFDLVFALSGTGYLCLAMEAVVGFVKVFRRFTWPELPWDLSPRFRLCLASPVERVSVLSVRFVSVTLEPSTSSAYLPGRVPW